jgi:hypothetical protein
MMAVIKTGQTRNVCSDMMIFPSVIKLAIAGFVPTLWAGRGLLRTRLPTHFIINSPGDVTEKGDDVA